MMHGLPAEDWWVAVSTPLNRMVSRCEWISSHGWIIFWPPKYLQARSCFSENWAIWGVCVSLFACIACSTVNLGPICLSVLRKLSFNSVVTLFWISPSSSMRKLLFQAQWRLFGSSWRVVMSFHNDCCLGYCCCCCNEGGADCIPLDLYDFWPTNMISNLMSLEWDSRITNVLRWLQAVAVSDNPIHPRRPLRTLRLLSALCSNAPDTWKWLLFGGMRAHGEPAPTPLLLQLAPQA